MRNLADESPLFLNFAWRVPVDIKEVYGPCFLENSVSSPLSSSGSLSFRLRILLFSLSVPLNMPAHQVTITGPTASFLPNFSQVGAAGKASQRRSVRYIPTVRRSQISTNTLVQPNGLQPYLPSFSQALSGPSYHSSHVSAPFTNWSMVCRPSIVVTLNNVDGHQTTIHSDETDVLFVCEVDLICMMGG